MCMHAHSEANAVPQIKAALCIFYTVIKSTVAHRKLLFHMLIDFTLPNMDICKAQEEDFNELKRTKAECLNV